MDEIAASRGLQTIGHNNLHEVVHRGTSSAFETKANQMSLDDMDQYYLDLNLVCNNLPNGP